MLSLSPPRSTPLNVFLQINTSSEESKSGVLPLSTTPTNQTELEGSELIQLTLHILTQCPGIRIKGLMTIGSFTASHSDEPNPDFSTLVATRDNLLSVLIGLSENGHDGIKNAVEEMKRDGLELSMGMSEDFVKAIKAGSTNVRVGSRIFGARPPRG